MANVAVRALYRCRSEPQIAVLVTRSSTSACKQTESGTECAGVIGYIMCACYAGTCAGRSHKMAALVTRSGTLACSSMNITAAELDMFVRASAGLCALCKCITRPLWSCAAAALNLTTSAAVLACTHPSQPTARLPILFDVGLYVFVHSAAAATAVVAAALTGSVTMGRGTSLTCMLWLPIQETACILASGWVLAATLQPPDGARHHGWLADIDCPQQCIRVSVVQVTWIVLNKSVAH